MRKAEIDHILTTMLEALGNISELNITVGKAFQVESSGQLKGVPIVPPIEKLTLFQAEIFGSVTLDENSIYQTLIEMPMVTRRNIFFAFVGMNFKSLNNMQAFQKSANIFINEKDLEKLGDILKNLFLKMIFFIRFIKKQFKQ